MTKKKKKFQISKFRNYILKTKTKKEEIVKSNLKLQKLKNKNKLLGFYN